MSDFHDMTFTHLATEAIYVLLVLQSQVRIVLDATNGDNALLCRHESQLTNKSFASAAGSLLNIRIVSARHLFYVPPSLNHEFFFAYQHMLT